MAYRKFVAMDIGIVGSGKVGSALAQGLAEAGHRVFVGVRDEISYSGRFALEGLSNVHIVPVEELQYYADAIILAVPGSVLPEVVYNLGDLSERVILDTTYGSRLGQMTPYRHGVEAIQRISGCKDVVKVFNTTTYHNLINPHLSEELIEMYAAGTSQLAKNVAFSLCRDLRFENSYDLGGLQNVALLEEMANTWIGLAEKPAVAASAAMAAGIDISRL